MYRRMLAVQTITRVCSSQYGVCSSQYGVCSSQCGVFSALTLPWLTLFVVSFSTVQPVQHAAATQATTSHDTHQGQGHGYRQSARALTHVR